MKLFRLLPAAALAVSLGGCSLIPDSAITKDAKLAVASALTSYADIYQPAVLAYGRLPICPDPTPSGSICHDQLILAKLKAIDLATTSTIVTAKGVLDGSSSDTGTELTNAINAITAAQSQITATGIMTMGGK